jgi:hypothetical protein
MSQCLDHNFYFKYRISNKIDGIGKLIKTQTNMSEIAFSKFRCLLCQNLPAIKDRNSGRIWNSFPTWIEVSISYLDKKTQEMIFLEFQWPLGLVCSL